MQTSSLYWFTLTTRATSSFQKPLGNPLSNQTRLQTPHTKVVDLEPLKKHTTFGKPHQEYWSWTPQEHTTLLGNTRTENTKDWERITPYQSTIWKENNCNLIPLSLENPKLDVNLENLRSNMSNWISQNCFLHFRNI